MKKNMFTGSGIVELTMMECQGIKGGNGILDHLRCVRNAYMNSRVKTLLLGGTIWGAARGIGIAVGCGG